MNVVISYIHYPVSMAGYMHRALRRMKDVNVLSVGPYTKHWIPWNGGMVLPEKYANEPDIPTQANIPPDFNTPISTKWIESRLITDYDFHPDVWLHVDAGWSLVGKPRFGKNFFIATDPHALNYDRQRKLADIFFCMQTPYMKNGDKYLPYAYDIEAHQYIKGTEKKYDAALIGLPYVERIKWVDRLKRSGLEVYFNLGDSFDEAKQIYNSSPIGLHWSSKQDLCARVWEYLAMNRLAIVNDVPDLHKFFSDGENLVIFKDLDDAVAKTLYYHENPDMGLEIANKGKAMIKPHTWENRMKEVLSHV